MHPALGVLATILITQAIWAAQVRSDVATDEVAVRVARNDERLQDHDRRLKDLEDLKIDARLVAIETQLKTGNTLQYTSTGGLVVLVAEAFIRRKRYKLTDTTDDNDSKK